MRVVAKSSLQKFWERPGCADARGPLHSWYVEAVKATWRTPQDIKDQYARASICGNNRVVFNVGGRVSEVLNRKRALSLRMVKRLHDGLRIPYESLLAGVR